MADVRHLAIEDTDEIINNFYENLYAQDGDEKPLLSNLNNAEKNALAKKDAELHKQPEIRELDAAVEKQTKILAANGVNGHEAIQEINGDHVVAN